MRLFVAGFKDAQVARTRCMANGNEKRLASIGQINLNCLRIRRCLDLVVGDSYSLAKFVLAWLFMAREFQIYWGKIKWYVYII